MQIIGRLVPALLTAALGLAAANAGGRELRLYRPQNRPAAELAALLAPVLGPSVGALADASGGALILSGEPEALERALELLGSLDVAPRQFRIETRLIRREGLRTRGVRISGWLELGALRVGRLLEADPAAAARLEAGELRADIDDLHSRSKREFAGSLLVMEGRAGDLWSDTLLPLRAQGSGVRVLVGSRTGFRVRPRQLRDGVVDLELVAIASEPGASGAIRETSASLRLQLETGEWLAVADTRRIASSEGRTTLGGEGARHAEDALILVRVSLTRESDRSP